VSWWWSWLLNGLCLVGMWGAGGARRWGWLVSLSAQPVYFAYGVMTGQYGFAVAALVYAAVFARNFRRATGASRIARRGCDEAQR